MDRVVRATSAPLALQPGDGLRGRQVEMPPHLRFQGTQPEVRIGAIQERGDTVGVRTPARLRFGQPGLVAGPGGGDHVRGDEDVLPELSRESSRGRLAVERPQALPSRPGSSGGARRSHPCPGALVVRLMIASLVQTMWSSQSLRRSFLSAGSLE